MNDNNNNNNKNAIDIIKILKITSYFIIWYSLTIVYNISSKKLLDIFPLPASISVIQLIIGIPVFLPIWLYKSPVISNKNIEQYSKIAFFHGMGNYATCISLGSGAVSFTHIVKAAEPIFSAILSALIFKTIFPFEVYLSLFPIVIGVGLASSKELSFTWISFFSAMASNLFYQLRIVLAKKEMTSITTNNNNTNSNIKSIDKTLSKMENNTTIAVRSPDDTISPENLFRIITIISAIQLIPIALLIEGSVLQSSYNSVINSGNYEEFISSMLISGVSYYMYNEVAFWILGLVHPISHAVGNTIKRVVIIFASIILLKTPITTQGMIGSMIAVLGTLAYSLVLFQYEKQQKNKQLN
jgi:solute carrier family 35 protein E1